MWLAAKYGGFTDLNNNAIPDPGEWENPQDGTPKNFFQAQNLAELPLRRLQWRRQRLRQSRQRP
jgi:hypothetical protein